MSLATGINQPMTMSYIWSQFIFVMFLSGLHLYLLRIQDDSMLNAHLIFISFYMLSWQSVKNVYILQLHMNSSAHSYKFSLPMMIVDNTKHHGRIKNCYI